jgi:hypothetical protein
MKRLRFAVLLLLLLVVMFAVHCILVIGAPGDGNSGGGQLKHHTVSLAIDSSHVRYVFVIEDFVTSFFWFYYLD